MKNQEQFKTEKRTKAMQPETEQASLPQKYQQRENEPEEQERDEEEDLSFEPNIQIMTLCNSIHLICTIESANDKNAIPGSLEWIASVSVPKKKEQQKEEENPEEEKKPERLIVQGEKYLLVGNGRAENELDEFPLQFVINFWPLHPESALLISPQVPKENSFSSSTTTTTAAIKRQERKVINFFSKQNNSLLLRTPRSLLRNQELTLFWKPYFENPGVLDYVIRAKSDYLYYVAEDAFAASDNQLMNQVFYNALFALPHDGARITPMPNAEKRFCIDLTQAGIDFLKSKKCKKVINKKKKQIEEKKKQKEEKKKEEKNEEREKTQQNSSVTSAASSSSSSSPASADSGDDEETELQLVITSKFADFLAVAQEFHEIGANHAEGNDGTWITSTFIETLQKMAQDKTCPVRLYSCALLEKKIKNKKKQEEDEKPQVAAATFSFLVGQVSHDYTMCTPKLDNRGLGTFLTKLQCHLLRAAGCKNSYWGMKAGGTAYMQAYEGAYGGVELERKDFYEMWNELRVKQLPKKFAQSLKEEVGKFGFSDALIDLDF